MKSFRKCTQIEFNNNQHDINQGGKEKVCPNKYGATYCKSMVYMGKVNSSICNLQFCKPTTYADNLFEAICIFFRNLEKIRIK